MLHARIVLMLLELLVLRLRRSACMVHSFMLLKVVHIMPDLPLMSHRFCLAVFIAAGLVSVVLFRNWFLCRISSVRLLLSGLFISLFGCIFCHFFWHKHIKKVVVGYTCSEDSFLWLDSGYCVWSQLFGITHCTSSFIIRHGLHGMERCSPKNNMS